MHSTMFIAVLLSVNSELLPKSTWAGVATMLGMLLSFASSLYSHNRSRELIITSTNRSSDAIITQDEQHN